MQKTLSLAALALCLVWLAPVSTASAADHRFGIGANYWKTVNDIRPADFKDIDENGLSWYATYQYAPAGIFRFEGDLEYYPDLAGGGKAVFAPEAFVLVGGTLYAGAGAGIYYTDGNWGDQPFFMLRGGFDIQILPFLFVDINANYRFNDWDTLHGSDLKTSTITLGAAARLAL